MKQRSKYSGLLLTCPGATLPPIPSALRGFVWYEKVTGMYDGPPLDIDQYDEYWIHNAIPGLSPKAAVRLQTKDSKQYITWITGRDYHDIYYIQNGQPEPRANYEICPKCKKTTGRRVDYKPEATKPKFDNRIYFQCTDPKCRKLYYYLRPVRRAPKRQKVSNKQRQYRTNPKNKISYGPP